jgi:hypothetical protein
MRGECLGYYPSHHRLDHMYHCLVIDDAGTPHLNTLCSDHLSQESRLLGLTVITTQEMAFETFQQNIRSVVCDDATFCFAKVRQLLLSILQHSSYHCETEIISCQRESYLFILSWAAKSAVSMGPSLATLKESLDRIALVFLSTGQSGVLHLLKEWNAFRHCSLPPKQPNSPTLSETAPEPVTTVSPSSISISISNSNKEEKEDEEEEEEEESASSTFVSNDDYLGWESVELSADVRIHCERTLEDALQDSCIMSAALLMGPRLIAGFPSWHEDQIPPSSSVTTSSGSAHSESVGSVSFNPLRSRSSSSNHAARGAKEESTPSLAASASASASSARTLPARGSGHPICAPALLTHRTDGSFPAIAGMWRQICAFTHRQENSGSSPVSKTQRGNQSLEHSANQLSVHSQEECDPADGNASWYSSNESQHTESFHDFSNDTAEKVKVKDRNEDRNGESASASDNDPSALMETLDLHPVGSFYLPAETSGMSQFREHVRANLNASFGSSVRTPPDSEVLEKETETEKEKEKEKEKEEIDQDDMDDTDDTDRELGENEHDHASSVSPLAMPLQPPESCQCLWHVAGRRGYIIALPASFAPGWIYAILKSDSSIEAIEAMETLRESVCATLSDVLAYVCVRSQTHLRIRDFALHIPGLFWFVLVDRLTARLVIPTGDNSRIQRQMIARLNAYRLNLKQSSARFTLQRDSTCSLSSSIWQEDNDNLSSSSPSQEASTAAATVAYPFSSTHPSATNSIRYELHLALHPSMGYAAVLVMHGKLWELLKDYRESSPL